MRECGAAPRGVVDCVLLAVANPAFRSNEPMQVFSFSLLQVWERAILRNPGRPRTSLARCTAHCKSKVRRASGSPAAMGFAYLAHGLDDLAGLADLARVALEGNEVRHAHPRIEVDPICFASW